MRYVYSDGGRAAAGYKSKRDCVCRALSVATNRGYFRIRSELAHLNEATSGAFSGGDGIHTDSAIFCGYMIKNGWEKINVDCGIDDLPESGTLIVKIHKHYFTIIDGAIYDVVDPRQMKRNRVEYYYEMDPNSNASARGLRVLT